MFQRNYGKRLGIDRENRFFHIEVTFPNLHHPQLFIKDDFFGIKGRQFLCKSPNNTAYCFIVTKRQSCSPSVNNAEKQEHKGDVKGRCLFFKHPHALLVLLFGMGCDPILDLNPSYSELRTNKNLLGFF